MLGSFLDTRMLTRMNFGDQQHELHEKMQPWISKKITEFLGEEETTLVDFIVSNTRKHVPAASMLELLESILDDEAEMFVLKMWRMLIFEIRRVETGLASNKHKS
jgi:RNA-binding protein 25